jgi:hypothetical protein
VVRIQLPEASRGVTRQYTATAITPAITDAMAALTPYLGPDAPPEVMNKVAVVAALVRELPARVSGDIEYGDLDSTPDLDLSSLQTQVADLHHFGRLQMKADGASEAEMKQFRDGMTAVQSALSKENVQRHILLPSIQAATEMNSNTSSSR